MGMGKTTNRSTKSLRANPPAVETLSGIARTIGVPTRVALDIVIEAWFLVDDKQRLDCIKRHVKFDQCP